MNAMSNWCAALCMLALSATAQAALVDRGGGMIYDTTRNLTWLADMNYAFTSGYATAQSGRMTWSTANVWAENLVYGGYDDWRLPTISTSDPSCNAFDPGGGYPLQHYGYCSGGELGGLFITDLGENDHESVLDQTGDSAQQIANLVLFINVQSYYYWSGTPYAPNSEFERAWYFNTQVAYQLDGRQISQLYAVAVRQGDVLSQVPEPQTLALSLFAIGAAMMKSRRRSRMRAGTQLGHEDEG